VRDNPDGSVSVVGLLDPTTNEWVGESPDASGVQVDGSAETQIEGGPSGEVSSARGARAGGKSAGAARGDQGSAAAPVPDAGAQQAEVGKEGARGAASGDGRAAVDSGVSGVAAPSVATNEAASDADASVGKTTPGGVVGFRSKLALRAELRKRGLPAAEYELKNEDGKGWWAKKKPAEAMQKTGDATHGVQTEEGRGRQEAADVEQDARQETMSVAAERQQAPDATDDTAQDAAPATLNAELITGQANEQATVANGSAAVAEGVPAGDAGRADGKRGTGEGSGSADSGDSGRRGAGPGRSGSAESDVGGRDPAAAAVSVGGGTGEPLAGNVRSAGADTDGGATPTRRRRAAAARDVGEGRPDGGRDGRAVEPVPGVDAGVHSGGVGRGADGRVAPNDFRATPEALARTGSWYETAARNIELIELAQRITDAGRKATPDEQAELARYVGFGAGEIRNNLFPVPSAWAKEQEPGSKVFPKFVEQFHTYKGNAADGKRWGALAARIDALPDATQESILRSTQYAHYTSPAVIQTIWRSLERIGFTGGRVLEPGMGVGHFATLMPEGVKDQSHYTGVEFDGATAMIAKLLLPDQTVIHGDFTKRKLPRDFYDAAIGNPPFARTTVTNDPEYAKHEFSLHDYFFAKSLDRVRPGGVLVFVTSRYTMDKVNDKARKYLSERADLLGAVRLPQTAFKANAGTDVVTDVLFLRKREAGEEPGGQSWTGVDEIQTPEGPVKVNAYFAAHPEMVLGETRLGGTGAVDAQGRRINSLRPGELVVVSYDDSAQALEAKFAQALERLPTNVYSALRQDAEAVRRETAVRDFDPKVKREGVLYLGDDGSALRVENGVGVALADVEKLSEKERAWVGDYVALRDAVQEARFAQLRDDQWKASLKRLNARYDAFRKTHGPIMDFRWQTRKGTDDEGNPIETRSRVYKNKRLLRMDYDSALVTQLEAIKEDGSIVKAPFLKDRTVAPPVVREVRSAADALAVSLDSLGDLDLDDVAARMGVSRAEAVEQLGDLVYETPQGRWDLADAYLSGDVRAKLAEAQAATQTDQRFARNVTALEAVQPVPLGPSQITVQLGAGWVPSEMVSRFAQEELGAGAVAYDRKSEAWSVEGSTKRSGRSAAAEWGTSDKGPSEILAAVLNNRPLKVTKTIGEGSNRTTVTDKEGTAAVNELAKKMRQRFRSWVWADGDRAATLLDIYNRERNNIALRRFDGEHLTLPGLSLRFSLYPHQKRAIWRVIQTGNTYLAHAVGAGKTLEMIVAGMEQRRLGLIQKPMYVVPNHMLEQFSNEFMQAYPLANLLVADDENFSKERRKQFVAATAMNNPDAVIITHSAFKRLGMSDESVAPIRTEILDAIADALEATPKDQDGRVRRSQLEAQKEAIERRFDRVLQKGQDALVPFEEMGVDFLVVDEAHNHRKLDFTTNRKVKGVDSNGSWAAMDLYVKTRHLESKRPGRSFVLASGTPVTNTVGELYSIMRFFAGDAMEQDGISTFDAWATEFGEVATDFERNAAGKLEPVERFAAFANVPELMNRVRQFMDVLTGTQLGGLVKRPDLEGGKPEMVLVEPSEALSDYMRDVLEPRLEKSKKWKPSKDQPSNPDPVIAIIGDARVASIDPRFIGGEVSEDQPSKLMVMGDEIAKAYKAGRDRVYLDADGKPEALKGSTQIVFFNLGMGEQAQKNRGFNARKALTDRIVAGGVPKGAIAWFDDADTDAKKEAIFRDMRAGKISVLIGSAKKMGTGVNVQKRLEVLHYLDPPWYPADVEQPHGRIIRQGNQNPTVRIKWFSTKETYEATMWQMVARKQRFIDQALSGDPSLRRIEDISEASQFEMAAALVSGDPRIMELAQATRDVERLTMLLSAHAIGAVRLRQQLAWDAERVAFLARRVPVLESAAELVKGYQTFKDAVIRGRAFDKRGEAGDALVAAFNAVLGSRGKIGREPVEIGTLNGGLVTLLVKPATIKGDLVGGTLLARIGEVDHALSTETKAIEPTDDNGRWLASALRSANDLAREAQERKAELAQLRQGMKDGARKLEAPFEYAQELIEAQTRRAQIEEELTSEGKAIPLDGSAAAALSDEQAAAAMDSEGGGQAVRFHLAYHGTPGAWAAEPGFPHGRPRLDFISDLGLAAAGWGFYSTQTESTARGYKELEALDGSSGRAGSGALYRLDIPDEVMPHLLAWNAPIGAQPDAVRDVLMQSGLVSNPQETGGELYRRIAKMMGSKRSASELMAAMGIPGNSHPDVSLDADGVNYVIWDQGVLDRIATLERNGKALDALARASLGSLRQTARPAVGESVSVEALRGLVEQVTQGWSGLERMPIQVVRSERGLPDVAREKLRRLRAVQSDVYPKAVMVPDDGIYLIAGNLSSRREALSVLAEEVVGHYGVRQVMGGRLDGLLDQIADERAEQVSAMAKRYGLDMERVEQRLEAAEEYLAHMARLGDPADLTLLKRVYQAVRAWMREMGFKLRLSDGDLRAILAASRRYVERGGELSRNPLQLAPAFPNSPGVRFHLADPADDGGSPLGGGRALMSSIRDLVQGAGQWAGDAWRKALPQTLGAVTLRQLNDLGRQVIPGIDGYVSTHQQMETYRNAMTDESGVFASDVWERWERKNRTQARELSDLMNDTTMANVDPSNYQTLKVMLRLGPGELFLREREATDENVQALIKKARQLVRSRAKEDRGMAGYYVAAAKLLKKVVAHEKRRKNALPALQKRWAALSSRRVFDNAGAPYASEQAAQTALHTRKDLQGLIVYPREAENGGWVLQEAGAQQIYRQARDLYKARSEQMMKALLDRIKESETIAADDKVKLAAKIRADFESTVNPETGEPKVDPYFPVHRFGRYYLSAKLLPEGGLREFRQIGGMAFKSEQAALSASRKRKDLQGIKTRPEQLENGDWVLMEVPDYGFWTFESLAERRAADASLQAEGWSSVKTGLTEETRSKAEAVSEGFASEAVAKLRKAGDEDSADLLYQLYLSTLHSMSMRKRFMHRKKTKGYARDQLRAFGWNMTRMAHQVAKLQYMPRLERMLGEIKQGIKSTPSGDVTKADMFYQEMERRHEWIAKPSNSGAVNFLNGLGFFWFLGATPGAALVNLSQTAIVALPVLSGRFGDWNGASKALGKAFLDVSRGFTPAVLKGFVTGRPLPTEAVNLTDEERAAFAAWDLSGVRDMTRAHNLAGIGDSDAWHNGPTFNRAMSIISSGFHAAEVLNRDVTLLAAYRLARGKGLGHQAAIKAADEATWESHFDYGNANRARVMQSNAAKLFLMFKSYSQHMTYFLARNLFQMLKGESAEVRKEARTKFLGILGMTSLFAGSLGLPGVWAAFAVANALAAAFGDDDEPWDAEVEFRNMLARVFPKTMADIIDRGAMNTVTGMDWASRVSLSQLWFRSPERDLDGAGMYQNAVEQIIGPIGGIASSPFTAADLIAEGHWERAAEAVSPKFLRDLLATGRFAAEGVQSRRGDPVLERDELGAHQLLWKALGMNPDAISVRQDANQAVKLYEKRILNRRSRLMSAYALGAIHGDDEVRSAALEKIRAFNKAQPEINISMQGLRTSIRNRERYTEQAKTGIVVNKHLQGVREVGAFAG
jgi:N12 class adenine-specific DNA methylase